jgi:hypothetical protein
MTDWLALARAGTGTCDSCSDSSVSSDRCPDPDLSELTELSEQPLRASQPGWPEPIGANGAIGTAPPISAEEVRATVEWAVHRFIADDALPLPEAQARAVALVRGELLNDPRLTPKQPNATQCLVCAEAGRHDNPLVPVLTPAEEHLWLHLEHCHAQHLKCQAEKADKLLATALNSKAA